MLQRLIDRLTAEGGPLRVRSILAFTVAGVFSYLAIVEGTIPTEDIKEVTLLVMAFYFITRAAQAAGK